MQLPLQATLFSKFKVEKWGHHRFSLLGLTDIIAFNLYDFLILNKKFPSFIFGRIWHFVTKIKITFLLNNRSS